MSSWFGEVPEGWVTARLKTVVQDVRTGVWGNDPDGNGDDIRCVRVADFDRPALGVGEVTTLRRVTPAERDGRTLWPGDLLLEKSGGTPANPVGFVAMFSHNYPAVMSNFISRVRLKEPHSARYWLYAMSASYATGLTHRSVKQTTGIQNLDQGSFFDERFPVPPAGVQRAIADFLDRETAQIDMLIAKQEGLIGLLDVRIAAIVATALDRLEWNSPLRSVVSLVQTGPFGSQLNAAEYEPNGTPVINPSHIVGGGIVPDPTVAVDSTKAASLSRHMLRANDLIVARRGELGRAAVVQQGDAGYLCGTGCAIIRPEETRIDSDFLKLVYTSARNRDALALASVGSTMENVNASSIGSLRIPTPPTRVQAQVLHDSSDASFKIGGLVAKAEEFIALAKERRSALITAAVTGQIDVRRLA